MTKRKRYALVVCAVCAFVVVLAILVTGRILSVRFEPYIREQAIQYLQKRFDSDVELAALRVRIPNFSAFRMFRTRGRGVIAHVDGEGIALRFKGRRDIPPLFAMKKFGFDVDLGTILDKTKTVRLVTLDGMEITIPPKGERPKLNDDKKSEPSENASEETGVIIEEAIFSDAKLVILSRKPSKEPLQFDIHRLRLESTGKDAAMKYEADLTNAKPPGEIISLGTFGPWKAEEPGDTPLAGHYTFDNVDLGVFEEIAGILASTGDFEGTLGTINVRGEASVPDFRLRISGNRVPLKTHFEVLVDGTDGDTVLKPVVARLGTTDFTTSGAVLKHEGQDRRTITLDVNMPNGNLVDLLRLAMKGSPFMQGRINLKTKIEIPALYKKVKEKILLNGQFKISDSKFLKTTIQDKIDGLSRRAQGQPKNEAIDEVVAGMTGVFSLENQIITFRALSFAVPGAAIDLAGAYQFDGPIDFHGTMRLQAKVSQTMSGWKRWVLKPADPFFSKQGAGTFLKIKVDGTADDPKFGLDRSKKNEGQ